MTGAVGHWHLVIESYGSPPWGTEYCEISDTTPAAEWDQYLVAEVQNIVNGDPVRRIGLYEDNQEDWATDRRRGCLMQRPECWAASHPPEWSQLAS